MTFWKIKNKKWKNNIKNNLDILKKIEKEQKFKYTHTADGVKLKVGLIVFLVIDPHDPWTITNIENKTGIRKNVTVKKADRYSKVSSTKLYCSQERAVPAAMEEISNKVKIIERDYKESMERLNAVEKMKKICTLRNELSKERKKRK